MSIRPIDLTTLFSQLNQAGKEQAVEKNQNALNQSQQQLFSVKQAEQNDQQINKTEKPEENMYNIGDEEKRNQGETEKKEGRKGSKDDKNKQYIIDPDLGHNLDVTR